MKNLYPFLILLFLSLNIYAQSPEKMSYQAIVRDANNTLVANKTIGMKISILQSNITGTVVYAETHTVDTNLNGLVSLEIGRGSTSDNFSTIDWSAGPYFIKTETDPTGGSSYTITGTSQLMSVPFALYANTSGSSQINATNIAKNKTAIELNTAKVGYTETLVSANADVVANTAKTGITSDQADAIVANTAKTGITTDQANAITANTAKTSMVLGTTASTALAGNTTTITSDQSSAITVNTAKTGITSDQADAIVANTAKTGITTDQANAITANTAKTSMVLGTTASTALAGNTTTITSDQASAILANTGKITNATHTGDVTGDKALTIANDAVTSAKIKDANITDAKIVTVSASKLTGAVGVANGGTNISSYRPGDFLYADSDGELTTLAKGTAGQVLVMDTRATAPEWMDDAGVAEGGYREGAFLYAGSDGKLTSLNAGTAGHALVMNSSGKAPEWKAAASGVAKDGYTEGDFLYAGGRGELTTLSAGRAGQVLVMDADGTAPEWTDAAGGVAKDGYTAGDFLYAGGRGELTTLSAGRAGQVLVMDADGTAPEWGSATKPYSIGDFAHGGIVFWVDETGQHGLVCAKEDQSERIRWYGGTNGNTQAKGDGVYAGKANTAIIIAAQVAIGDDGVTYAARICNELQITEGGKTYGDWYLPSNHELNLMYQNVRTINTTAGNNRGSDLSNAYWSSTEIDNDGAWKMDFSDGRGVDTNKSTTSNVRAVRAF